MNFNDKVGTMCHPERVSRSPERSEGEGSRSMGIGCFAEFPLSE